MSGKVVVVTGASAGIGAAAARALAAAGHRVALAARREAALRDVAAACGAGALAVPTDVTRREQVERLRDEALRAFGRVDVWINNAGRGINRRVLELSDADLDAMMAVNVKSALYGMQAIVPHFVARGDGHLVNVSSFLGRVPVAAHRSAYNAAKAALDALTVNLRSDLGRAHPGIHVSLVLPGMVATDFGRHVLGEPGAPPWGPGAGRLPGATVAQSAAEVGALIARLVEDPVPELYTTPALHALAVRYHQDPPAFEEIVRHPGPPAG